MKADQPEKPGLKMGRIKLNIKMIKNKSENAILH